MCGNGFVEPGEECDCGLREHCDNPCCNPETCRMYANATCATGRIFNFSLVLDPKFEINHFRHIKEVVNNDYIQLFSSKALQITVFNIKLLPKEICLVFRSDTFKTPSWNFPFSCLGKCCDLKTCQPKLPGEICRLAEHECDLPEYCTGKSEFCPSDIFKVSN
ncbi:MAG: hypothetical protein GY696_29625, partial [Gammaproteobacteria bacterium]|nr:hypothetical protein [Gammaproteobacteria bacterium]